MDCLVCGNTVDKRELRDNEDAYNELCAQADALGIESLTETQQVYVDRRGYCCDDCYYTAE